MLETSAVQQEATEGIAPDDFLFNGDARLSCQINLTEEFKGITVMIPDTGPNMLEVPLWLRPQR
jgi:hypothetical protein